MMELMVPVKVCLFKGTARFKGKKRPGFEIGTFDQKRSRALNVHMFTAKLLPGYIQFDHTFAQVTQVVHSFWPPFLSNSKLIH